MPGTITHIQKTRLAPTPTGYLHLGNVYNFALTAALAHRYNAAILLRIDDLDHQRVNPAYLQDIFDTLNFLSIPWHEGPRNIGEVEKYWGQQHRMHLYNDALNQLRQQGLVFACGCSRSAVQQAGGVAYAGTCVHGQLPFEGNAWRLHTAEQQPLIINTLRSGVMEYALPAEMQHFIVRKKDGYPAYQLASVIDELYFKVDLVVRGADLLPSTIAQHYLAQKLQQAAFGNTVFHHHPLLLSEGMKLSKSAGSTSVQYLRRQGKSAADIYGMAGQLAGLGTIRSWKDIEV